jgi:hypothetical protein
VPDRYLRDDACSILIGDEHCALEEGGTLERNPYSPPSADVRDIKGPITKKTPWDRAAWFYWAFLWRAALIFAGMGLLFSIIYAFIKLMLDSRPLFEALVRLTCILAIASFASCCAISWAAQSSFRGYLLRSRDAPTAPGASQSWPDVIPLTRAGRLFIAHLWRYILIVLPINLTLIWLLVGLRALTAHDWVTVLKVQAINNSIGFVVGIWAMREALSVAYPGFQFQWVADEYLASPNFQPTQPHPSVERKL